MHMRFVSWVESNLCRAGLLKTEASELAKYGLGQAAVREVRWDKSGSQLADYYTFFYGSGNTNHHLWRGFFCVHKGIVQSV
jgi:hypothetical protein